MTPQEVLSAAKQGNPQAIAALMNRSLKPKGITAKVKLTDACLHVMLEGSTVPNQGASVSYVTNGIKGLGIAAIRSLVVYGRVMGEDLPAWNDRVELGEAVPTLDGAKNTEESRPAKISDAKEKSRNKRAEKFQAVIGLLGISIFLAQFVYSCGYPHDCTEATAKWRKEADIAKRWAADGDKSEGILQAQVRNVVEAYRQKEQKCNP